MSKKRAPYFRGFLAFFPSFIEDRYFLCLKTCTPLIRDFMHLTIGAQGVKNERK